MTLLLDIAVSVGQTLVGLAFLYAGAIKLHDLPGARIAVLDYRVVPPRLVGLVALVLGPIEVVAGLGLVAGSAMAPPLGLVLLAVLSTAAASALVRGLSIECHCFGEGEPLSRMTLARNVAMAAILAVSLFRDPPIQSPFTPQLVLAPLPYILSVGLSVATLTAFVALIRLSRLYRSSATMLKG